MEQLDKFDWEGFDWEEFSMVKILSFLNVPLSQMIESVLVPETNNHMMREVTTRK